MKTVFVGMSGGVDSSVTAALLKSQGYRVVGVYMQNWTRDVGGVECPWRKDLADARAVAAHLDIPLRVFDFQKEYKAKVVDYMVAEYRAGRTPNPDVMCNQEIKFNLFLNTALEAGADLIATGHYAGIVDGQLLKGRDQSKDQSYFLYRIDRRALEKTLMPIGELQKPEVRSQASELGLPTAAKPDSQGICFVGEVGVRPFLSQYIDAEPGPITLQDGRVIGQHAGAIFYTIGQRHGLGVGGGRPFYVVAKDMATNTVVVTPNPDDLELYCDEFAIESAHWLGEAPDPNRGYQVVTRYRGQPVGCRVRVEGLGYRVEMAKADRAITPGQSAVIYDGDVVIGGGIVASARPATLVSEAARATIPL